jgi:hypothetical protein
LKVGKKKALEKRGPGNPTKYDPAIIEQVEKLAMLGLDDKEMSNFFKVTERTWNNWKNAHPEFFQSLKKGREVADAEVAVSLYKRACGYSHKAVKFFHGANDKVIAEEYIEHYPPDTAACMIWLGNRRRDKWRRNPDPTGGEDDLPPTKVIMEIHDARKREG